MKRRERGEGALGALLFALAIMLWLSAAGAVASAQPTAERRGGTDVTIGFDPGLAGGVFVPGSGILTGPAIDVPASAWERPPQLYVLPVLVAPTGWGGVFPDPASPGLDLDGEPFAPDGSQALLFERARNNFSVHLQTARLMYRNMMRNPLDGELRGTFSLATWDAAQGVARRVMAPSQTVEPLILQLSGYDLDTLVSMRQARPRAQAQWVEQIFDTLGCKRLSCPFVLAIAVAGNPFDPVHGAKWNYGFNNGGGAAYFNYSTVLNSWDPDPDREHNFLSTLVHELGHAFGLPHSGDYCNVVSDCDDYLRFDMDLGASIMSYNLGNRIYGCPRASRASASRCELPDLATIEALPGVLEREDMRVLAANRLAFPAFDYQPALDHPQPTDPVYSLPATGDWDVSTTGAFTIDSPDSHPNTAPPPILIGGYSERFLDIEEPNYLRTWVSDQGGVGTWALLNLRFGEPVTLARMRVYAGHDGDEDRPLGLQLFVAGDPDPLDARYNLAGPNHDLFAERTGTHFVLTVQRGASGLARLRGLRLFGRPAGRAFDAEFVPPLEPIATTSFGSTFGGDVANVVGSDQWLASTAAPFQSEASWHSGARAPDSWVSIDVDLGEERHLAGIMVSTGHTGGVHGATQIQVERECVCRAVNNGQGGVCKPTTTSHCAAAGGAGKRVYEVLRWDTSPSLDQYVDFLDATARRWRIALRVADGSPGDDAYMVVRSLRFFAAGNCSPY